MRKLPRDSGQALLLVLLSMAVVLTVVLSIVARSVTDITVSTKEEAALRAFSAAEAGVERALFVGTSTEGQLGDANFNAKVTGATASVSEFAYPFGLPSGDSQTVWFINHDASGNLVCNAGHPCFTGSKVKVCWGNAGISDSSATTPAIEASIFYLTTPGDYSTAKIARDTADPYSSRRNSGVGSDSPNKFSAPDAGSCQIGTKSFAFQKTIDFSALGVPSSAYSAQNGLQFARIRMFYNSDQDADLGISASFAGDTLLPPQGMTIESTGTAAEANRKVEVFQGYGEAPSVFDGALFSSSSITK